MGQKVPEACYSTAPRTLPNISALSKTARVGSTVCSLMTELKAAAKFYHCKELRGAHSAIFAADSPAGGKVESSETKRDLSTCPRSKEVTGSKKGVNTKQCETSPWQWQKPQT